MRCEHCEADFSPKTVRGRFCSAKCRKAAWQRKRRDEVAALEDTLTRALARVQALRCKT